MKNKKKQKSYIEMQRRAAHERLAAITLAALTVFSLVVADRNVSKSLREAIVAHPITALSHLLEKENETTRMPVRFDDGLRMPTIGSI